MQPTFIGKSTKVWQRRADKIKALDALNNPDSRRQRKQMNNHAYGKTTKTDTKDYWGKRRTCKVKYTKKCRHTSRASKSIMRGV